MKNIKSNLIIKLLTATTLAGSFAIQFNTTILAADSLPLGQNPGQQSEQPPQRALELAALEELAQQLHAQALEAKQKLVELEIAKEEAEQEASAAEQAEREALADLEWAEQRERGALANLEWAEQKLAEQEASAAEQAEREALAALEVLEVRESGSELTPEQLAQLETGLAGARLATSEAMAQLEMAQVAVQLALTDRLTAQGLAFNAKEKARLATSYAAVRLERAQEGGRLALTAKEEAEALEAKAAIAQEEVQEAAEALAAQEALNPELTSLTTKLADLKTESTSQEAAKLRYVEIYKEISDSTELSNITLFNYMRDALQDEKLLKSLIDAMAPKQDNVASQRAMLSISNRQINYIISDRGKVIATRASGDEDSQNGFWTKMFLNGSKQTAITNSGGSLYPEYNASGWGAVLGFDRNFSENSLVGFALTLLRNKLQYSDNNNHYDQYNGIAISGYTHVELTNKLFSDAVITYNSNDVKAQSLYGFAPIGSLASSSYKANNWNIETRLGYRIQSENVTFTPVIGLSATYFNSISYAETPNDVSAGAPINRNVSSSTNFSGLVGLTVNTKLHRKNVVFTPEFHALGDLYLGGSASKINNAYNNVQLLSSDIPKPNNTFNIGTSLNFDFKNIDVSLVYDVYLAKSFVGQQGSIKVKMSF